MAVPTAITDLSVTAASNYPLGTDSATTNSGPDEYFRAHAALLRRMQAQATATASATTVDIGTIATGNYVHITGTTTITGFGTVAAGVSRVLVFDDALILTHNSTSLILPGAANITTAAGDIAEFVSEGSGNWRCAGYVKASGEPIKLSDEITTLSGITAQQATDLASVSGFIGGMLNDADQATALSTLGALLNGVLSKSGAYPVVVADRGKLIDYTSAPFTLTLPTVATAGDGFVLGIKNSAASGVLTVGRNTANIDGAAADATLNPGDSMLIICDGTGWKTVGQQQLSSSMCAVTGTATSVGHAAWTTLDWASEVTDSGSWHDTSTNPDRITVPTDGIYRIDGCVTFSGNGSYTVGIKFYDGATLLQHADQVAPGGVTSEDVNSASTFVIASLAAGDYVTMQAFQVSGTSKTPSAQSQFTITKVA